MYKIERRPRRHFRNNRAVPSLFASDPSSVTSCDSWARRMGQRRRQHDHEFTARAQLHAVDEGERRTECLRRWPGIVAAIRSLIAAYNDGAGVEVLTISERGGDVPGLTVASQQPQRASVTIAVDDGDLSVRVNGSSRSAAGMHGRLRRIDCSRTDMATAAYLLQDWMEQLNFE